MRPLNCILPSYTHVVGKKIYLLLNRYITQFVFFTVTIVAINIKTVRHNTCTRASPVARMLSKSTIHCIIYLGVIFYYTTIIVSNIFYAFRRIHTFMYEDDVKIYARVDWQNKIAFDMYK